MTWTLSFIAAKEKYGHMGGEGGGGCVYQVDQPGELPTASQYPDMTNYDAMS